MEITRHYYTLELEIAQQEISILRLKLDSRSKKDQLTDHLTMQVQIVKMSLTSLKPTTRKKSKKRKKVENAKNPMPLPI